MKAIRKYSWLFISGIVFLGMGSVSLLDHVRSIEGPYGLVSVAGELVSGKCKILRGVATSKCGSGTLKSKGVQIRPADLIFLSPYATSKLKRFGDYPTGLKPEAMPTRTTLPI